MSDLGPWETPKPCWALHDDGRWYPGRLRMWRSSPAVLPGTTEGIAGLVTYSVGAGLQHYLWMHAERLRDGAEADPNPAEEAEPERPWA